MGVDCVFYIELTSEQSATVVFNELKSQIEQGKTPLTAHGFPDDDENHFQYINVDHKDKFEEYKKDPKNLYKIGEQGYLLFPLFAYCHVWQEGKYVIIKDGCRLHLNDDYQNKVLDLLESIAKHVHWNIIEVIGDDTSPFPWTGEDPSCYTCSMCKIQYPCDGKELVTSRNLIYCNTCQVDQGI